MLFCRKALIFKKYLLRADGDTKNVFQMTWAKGFGFRA